ncbi:unnamed protein product [Prorocentrum cordatum]|uniref:Altered inheritance of mitochondria protein 24, mitochondrial n=1 Tax=Prorocentrum cordatum TaxID=2364126 RepID=A0ABN9RR84_9DINO|nr:unnamed protein product [Polarella glacialis]
MPSPVEARAVEDRVPILAAEGHRAPQPTSRRFRLVASAAVVAVLAALAVAARGAPGGAPGGAGRPSVAEELLHPGDGGHSTASADELALVLEAEEPLVAAEDAPAAAEGAEEHDGAEGSAGASRATAADGAQFDSARQEKDPEAPLLLATDGTEFKFRVLVNGSGLDTWPTAKEIILDSGGAFFFQLKEGKVEFVMQMLNGGELHVVDTLKKDQMNVVTVNKVQTSLCMTVGMSIKCVDADGQMKIPGYLKWVDTDGTVAKEFIQLEGCVPLSFAVNGIVDEKLDRTTGSKSAYLEFENAIRASVALVGGFGVGKEDVTVAHGQSPNGPDSTTIQATAAKLGTRAPYVYQNLLAATPAPATSPGPVARRRLSEDVSLTTTLEKRINGIPHLDDIAAAPGEEVTVGNATVPAEPVSCDEFACGPFMKERGDAARRFGALGRWLPSTFSGDPEMLRSCYHGAVTVSVEALHGWLK